MFRYINKHESLVVFLSKALYHYDIFWLVHQDND